MNLEIAPNRTILYGRNKIYDLGSTVCALGNAIKDLEEIFPAEKYDGAFLAARIMTNIQSETDIAKHIWGIRENGESLLFFHNFVYGEDKVKLSLSNVEKLRIESNITTTFTLKSQIDKNEGFIFKVGHIREIIYALLYYYAFYGYHLVRCEHCGRWFATKSFKNKYCPRKTTFEGYTHLHCKKAVDDIKQIISLKYNRIRKRLSNRNTAKQEYYTTLFDFENQYSERISKRKSVENLQACLNWLNEIDKLEKRR